MADTFFFWVPIVMGLGPLWGWTQCKDHMFFANVNQKLS